MRSLQLLLVAMLASLPVSLMATPIDASVSCAANACTVTPNGGSVALDPLDFSLEIDWSPQHIKFTEPADDRVEIRVALLFDVTGDVSDVLDRVPVSGLDFVDMNGAPIGDIGPGFDDVTSFNPTLRINFEAFGPDTGSSYLAHGLTLARTQMIPITGAFETFAFREARISAIQGMAVDGIWVAEVPEPGTLGLLGLGFLATGLMRRRKTH